MKRLMLGMLTAAMLCRETGAESEGNGGSTAAQENTSATPVAPVVDNTPKGIITQALSEAANAATDGDRRLAIETASVKLINEINGLAAPDGSSPAVTALIKGAVTEWKKIAEDATVEALEAETKA